MAILILDPPGLGPVPAYSAWLRDSGQELVLLTGRPPTELPRRPPAGAAAGGAPGDGEAPAEPGAAVAGGYAEVRFLAGYASSADLERAAFELADRTSIGALVATAPADLVRAGALREHLEIPGQQRDDALTFADAVALREMLDWSGVPTVPVAPVERVADVYAGARRWGYPVHIRRRRYGWSSVSVLADEAATRSFTRGGLSESLQWMRSLMIEPWSIAEAGRVAGVLTGAGWRLFAVVNRDGARRLDAEPDQPGLLAAGRAALAALPAQAYHPYVVEFRRGEAGEWLTDTVGCDVADPTTGLLGRALHADVHRAVVRAQAGLPACREAAP